MFHFNETHYEANEPTTADPIFLFFSTISRNKEWILFLFFGGILETCRTVAFRLWHNLLGNFFVTAVFDDQSPCFCTFLLLLCVFTL
jgi:hypothetical protein